MSQTSPPQPTLPARLGSRLPRSLVWSLFALWMTLQAAFCVQGINNYWQWGHNGFNSAAYQQAARNTLRWGDLFPVQYIAGAIQPEAGHAYTHAPLGLHLHTTLSVWLFGDASNWPVRLVPALGALAAAWMLFTIARRRWGDLTALIALGVYVLLPINHSFANMSNHSSWMIFWGLSMFYCYLRWLDQSEPHGGLEGHSTHPKLWLLGIFACSGMCMFWDWPAYYLVFVLAVHWFYSSFRFNRPTLNLPFPLQHLTHQHILIAAFCIFVLANFFGFFAIVYSMLGSFEEIKTSFGSRHNAIPNVYSRLLRETLIPMFSPAVLGVSSLWLIGLLVRHARRDIRKDDVLIFGFFFAALLHTFIFKTTAVIHIYWPWPANPFVAMACAVVLVWFGTLIRDVLRATFTRRESLAWRIVEVVPAALLIGMFAYAYTAHTVPLVKEGRRVAGSFGFPNYKSEQMKVAFAEKLHAWTSFNTGLLVMRHFGFRIEFAATADRAQSWVTRADLYKPPPGLDELSDGWVLIGEVRRTPRSHLLRAAQKHPYRQFGLYYMIDYRKTGQDIQIWNVEHDPDPSLSWTVLHSAVEKPFRVTRDEQAEEKMAAEVERLSKRKPKPASAKTSPKKTVPKVVPKPTKSPQKPETDAAP